MSMTITQEAEYAINYGLDRGQLRPEVQAEYDRLQQERQFASAHDPSDQPLLRDQPPPSRNPAGSVPPIRLVIGSLVVVFIIVAAIVGHAIASGSSIAAGDCVVTNANVLTGWDIKKVACNANPRTALAVQKVVSVQNGSNGECGFPLTTFQDDPAGKTYCLTDYSFGG